MLRAELPPTRATVVEWVDMRPRQTGDYATTKRRGRVITIRVHDKLSFEFAIWALFEEWAHAMSWPFSAREDEVPHHDETWAIAYGKIRHLWDDLDGQERAARFPADA